jgi:hypothetical protein|tara:strand:+ start:638 stop:880 length:243 start_codon:yes stop_codon:yes gene_type:complete
MMIIKMRKERNNNRQRKAKYTQIDEDVTPERAQQIAEERGYEFVALYKAEVVAEMKIRADKNFNPTKQMKIYPIASEEER